LFGADGLVCGVLRFCLVIAVERLVVAFDVSLDRRLFSLQLFFGLDAGVAGVAVEEAAIDAD